VPVAFGFWPKRLRTKAAMRGPCSAKRSSTALEIVWRASGRGVRGRAGKPAGCLAADVHDREGLPHGLRSVDGRLVERAGRSAASRPTAFWTRATASACGLTTARTFEPTAPPTERSPGDRGVNHGRDHGAERAADSAADSGPGCALRQAFAGAGTREGTIGRPAHDGAAWDGERYRESAGDLARAVGDGVSLLSRLVRGSLGRDLASALILAAAEEQSRAAGDEIDRVKGRRAELVHGLAAERACRPDAAQLVAEIGGDARDGTAAECLEDARVGCRGVGVRRAWRFGHRCRRRARAHVIASGGWSGSASGSAAASACDMPTGGSAGPVLP
jgi:hypothetical protein